MGLVGFGRIAQTVVKKLAGFEMTNLAYDPFAKPETFARLFDEVLQCHIDSFLDLLQDKTNYLRNRPVNRGIFGRGFDTGQSGLIGRNVSRRSAVIKRAYTE